MIALLKSSIRTHQIGISKSIMIGRQNLHLSQEQLRDVLGVDGSNDNPSEKIMTAYSGFADGLLFFFGAKIVHSLDASDYEGASVIQDLNKPLKEDYKAQYDLVLDSGTLEHIFNIKRGLQNCMELTKVGGFYVGIYPCNNFFGHGFYQFSSELFYRCFSKEQGFELKDVILFIDKSDTKYYKIEDTSVKHPRVQFTNAKPVYIYVVAQRIEKVALFEKDILQTDYAQMKWKGNRPVAKRRTKKKNSLNQLLPPYVKNVTKAILNKQTIDDQMCFQRPYFKEYKL